MRKTRNETTTPLYVKALVISTAILGVVTGGYFLLGRGGGSPAIVHQRSNVSVATHRVQKRALPLPSIEPPRGNGTQTLTSAATGSPSPSEGDLQLQDQLISQVAHKGEFLHLTIEEKEKLTKTFLSFQAQKAELEERHLTVDGFDGATMRVTIGGYPNEGRNLREAFYNQLKRDFPSPRFEQIDDYMGGFFDNKFKGFGAMTQELAVSRSEYSSLAAQGLGGVYDIRWSARAIGELTPSGVPQKEGRATALSGSARLSYEMIRTGEYRYLSNAISSSLPPTQ